MPEGESEGRGAAAAAELEAVAGLIAGGASSGEVEARMCAAYDAVMARGAGGKRSWAVSLALLIADLRTGEPPDEWMAQKLRDIASEVRAA